MKQHRKKDVTIYIKTANGGLAINLDAFFPCSQARFRKLLKIITDFDWLNGVDEIMWRLKEYFVGQIRELDAMQEKQYGIFLKYRRREVGAHAVVASGRRPDGAQLAEGELKRLKEEYKFAKNLASNIQKDLKQLGKRSAGLQKNLEFLEQVK